MHLSAIMEEEMESVVEYRERAAHLRAEAAMMTLDNVRKTKLAAAQKFETMATEIENVIGPCGESDVADWVY